MRTRTARRIGAFTGGGAIVAVAAAGALAATGTVTGPSSSQAPYLTPTAPGVVTKSVLTVGDSVNAKADGTPYRMVGIPDGLGAFDNRDGTFTVLMNQELNGASAGVTRAHGAAGAFVSKWTIDKKTLAVRKGEDLIQRVALWNPTAGAYDAPASGVVFTRFCSADLPARSAFYDDGRGYSGRLFMNGEESGTEGRAFAHGLDGTSWELASLGKAAWENQVAQPESGRNTVVVGLDDGTGGQVYVYVGTKQRTGLAGGAGGPGRRHALRREGRRAPPRGRRRRHPLGHALRPRAAGRRLRQDRRAARRGQRRGGRQHLPAPGGRLLGPPGQPEVLLQHHGELHRQQPPLATELRRRAEAAQGRHDRHAARRQRGPEDARQHHRQPERPDHPAGGPGQPGLRGEGLELLDQVGQHHRGRPPR